MTSLSRPCVLALAAILPVPRWSPQADARRVPLVRLDAVIAVVGGEYDFVSSVREVSHGRVLVTDEKANQVVMAHVGESDRVEIGRVGSGPAEYRQVGRLWGLAGDSTLMSDRWQRRWIVFDAARIVATIPATDSALRAAGGNVLLGADASGHVVAGLADRNPVVDTPLSRRLVRISRSSGQTQVVAVLNSYDRRRDAGTPAAGSGQMRRGTGRGRYMVPMREEDAVATFPDGWIAIARVRPYRVDWCPPARACARGMTIETARGSINDAAKARYLTFLSVLRRSLGGGRNWDVEETTGWPEHPPPFVVPPFSLDASAALAASDGSVVVHRFDASDRHVNSYDVVRRTSRLVARIELPITDRIVGFGSRTVFVASTDDLGVQRVLVYGWPRPR